MTVQDWPAPTTDRPDDTSLNYMLRSDYIGAITDSPGVPADHVDQDAALAQRPAPQHTCTCECGCCGNDGSCSGHECECECGECRGSGGDGNGCVGHSCDCEHCVKACDGCNQDHCNGCDGPEEPSEPELTCTCVMCQGGRWATTGVRDYALVCTDGCVIAGTVKAGNAGDRCSHGHVTWLRHFRIA
jgi:hypothetical protein